MGVLTCLTVTTEERAWRVKRRRTSKEQHATNWLVMASVCSCFLLLAPYCLGAVKRMSQALSQKFHCLGVGHGFLGPSRCPAASGSIADGCEVRTLFAFRLPPLAFPSSILRRHGPCNLACSCQFQEWSRWVIESQARWGRKTSMSL